jgi:hypothetical protein
MKQRKIYIQHNSKLIEVVPSSVKVAKDGKNESYLRTRRKRGADIEGKDYFKVTDKIFLYPKKAM